MRRRAKAAIVNPKAEPAPPMASIESDPQDLPDEWWDDFRRRKRGQPTPADQPVLEGRQRTQTIERQPRPRSRVVRKGGGDRNKRGERKKSRLKGMDVVMDYKPSIPIPAARLTVRPAPSFAYCQTLNQAVTAHVVEGSLRQWTIVRSPLTGTPDQRGAIWCVSDCVPPGLEG